MDKPIVLPEILWDQIEPLLPARRRRTGGRGRPPKHHDRTILEGIFWILRTVPLLVNVPVFLNVNLAAADFPDGF